MALQDLKITATAHLCTPATEGELRTIAKKVSDAIAWNCNTIVVTAHYDEHGVGSDIRKPLVIDVEYDNGL